VTIKTEMETAMTTKLTTRNAIIDALSTTGWKATDQIAAGGWTIFKRSGTKALAFVSRRANLRVGTIFAESQVVRTLEELKALTPTAKREPKVKKTPEQILVEAEAELRRKYPHVIPGTIRFETEGKYKGKRTVEIATLGVDDKPDGGRRRVATSDLFQVRYSEEVAEKKRSERAKERYLARKIAQATEETAA